MSISPAQTMPQVSVLESRAAPRPSDVAAAPEKVDAAAPPAESSPPTVSSPPELKTNLRIDDQHQVYYEVINDRTGDEILEIPPEVLRKLGENLNFPLFEGTEVHRVDVKS